MMHADISGRSGKDVMSLVKVRRAAQITLPGDIRKALQVEEGDYLEAELVEGGVLLRPVTVVDKAQAWNRLERILGKARFTGPGEEPSEQDAMKIAVQTIKDVRRGKREGRS